MLQTCYIFEFSYFASPFVYVYMCSLCIRPFGLSIKFAGEYVSSRLNSFRLSLNHLEDLFGDESRNLRKDAFE